MRTALLAAGVCALIACSTADEPVRSDRTAQAAAGRGGSPTALVPPPAGTTAPAPAAGSRAGVVTGPGAGTGAVGATAGRAAVGPIGPVGMAGSAPMSAGGSGAPAQPPAAGAPAPRTPATRSSGCGKPNTMVGAFQAQIRAFELDRGYFMSVPKTYDPERAHRLVFGYHGSNYTGMRMRQYLDNEKAPLLDGTIFVYPDGLPLPNQPDNIAWVLDAKGRDIAFFDALYDFVRSSYCIDETRVFVNGQSFGGLMTNFVGCQRGDVVRAIAVVAGSGPRGTCQGKVAVWLTHGMDDMNVSFSSGEASRNFWRAANGCMDVTMPGDPPQCLRYQGCDPEHPVIWCPHVNDGGHQHPSFGRKAVRDFLGGF